MCRLSTPKFSVQNMLLFNGDVDVSWLEIKRSYPFIMPYVFLWCMHWINVRNFDLKFTRASMKNWDPFVTPPGSGPVQKNSGPILWFLCSILRSVEIFSSLSSAYVSYTQIFAIVNSLGWVIWNKPESNELWSFQLDQSIRKQRGVSFSWQLLLTWYISFDVWKVCWHASALICFT